MLPKILKKAGYYIGCTGKCDLHGHKLDFDVSEQFPTENGFDYNCGLPTSNDFGVLIMLSGIVLAGIAGIKRDKLRQKRGKEIPGIKTGEWEGAKKPFKLILVSAPIFVIACFVFAYPTIHDLT